MLSNTSIPFSTKVLLLAVFFVGLAGGLIGALAVGKYQYVNSNITEAGKNNNSVLSVTEESATTDVADKTKPSVVSILAYKEVSYNDLTGTGIYDEFFNQTLPQRQQDPGKTEKQQVSGGSGFIISADGLILTNRHVVEDKTADYKVVLNDGTEFDAKVLARDTVNDFAFVKIEAKDLVPLPLGDSENIKIGETVIAIGNTLSEYSNTVTKGVVSGIHRKVKAAGIYGTTTALDSAIQTDAAINPGNSGGPLLNLSGQVIGINTAVDRGGEGLGFAIPINEAKSVVADVIAHGRIIRPFLGVRYVLINEKIAKLQKLTINHGAYVAPDPQSKESVIVKDSPADKAGIKEGDIIYKVNDQDVTEDKGLAQLLGSSQPGQTVSLEVRRGEKDVNLAVTLADRGDFDK